MAYTLGDLKAELQPMLWPAGEASNLITAHRAMYPECLIDLQQAVECLTINNVTTYPQCNTLFSCGITVLDAPQGRIRRLYVIDRINQSTGKEDASVPLDWCSKIDYRQVDYSDLDKYLNKDLAESNGFWWWFNSLFIAAPIFPWICGQRKVVYPAPTDAGLANAPILPLGYHYGQPSTDSEQGRSFFGLWAIKGGQLFVGPWIQSTEMIVVEWDGLKRLWADTDMVPNDPMVKEAVKYYIWWQNAARYERDYDFAESCKEQYNRLVAQLIYECQNENAEYSRNDASMARGGSSILPTFVNDAQSATATCPPGQTGNPVTVTIPEGTVVSNFSVADANSQAVSLALQQAGQQLQCATTPQIWENQLPHSATAQCGSGPGMPLSMSSTVLIGGYQSTISQTDAETGAYNLALANAQAILFNTGGCMWVNAVAYGPITVTCNDGTVEVGPVVAAGSVTSTDSQQDAEFQAMTMASNLAYAMCPHGTSFPNQATPYSHSWKCSCRNTANRTFDLISAGTIAADTIYRSSQGEANTAAQQQGQIDAQNAAYSQAVSDCSAAGGLATFNQVT